ncbi:MAG: ferric reductase-like transmembrane domain-containing protein [Frankia sp.]
MTGSALWYFSRGTGIVALLGLTGTTVLGIVTAKRVASPRWPRFVTQGLHRNLSLMTLTVLVLHIAAVVLDSYVSIAPLDAVVPFRAAYHPVWVGLGTLAVDLLIAVAATSLLRRHLGYRTWRAVHWAAYAVWPIAVSHGLGIGSDASTLWTRCLTGLCAAAVAGGIAWRLAGAARPRPPRHRPTTAPSYPTAPSPTTAPSYSTMTSFEPYPGPEPISAPLPTTYGRTPA